MRRSPLRSRLPYVNRCTSRAELLHVLVAPDNFKGSLSAAEVARHITRGLHAVVGDSLDVVPVPVADGGDGTLDAAFATGFHRVPLTASGPTGEPVETAYARRDSDAVVELASVCGLQQLPNGQLDPLGATSLGVGQVLAAALDAGCRRTVLGIGGSASTDGGAGMLVGLGARVLDTADTPLPRGGAALNGVASLDLSGLHPALNEAEFIVACDVNNPLYGPNGAAAVYGPQKGATEQDVATLDEGLRRWSRVVATATGHDHSSDPGAGAAGGVGFAAVAVLGANLRPGAELVLDLVGLRDRLSGCRLVITGEGSLDEQTLAGKAPLAVAAAARAAGVDVVAIVGQSTLRPEAAHQAGISAIYPLTDLEPDVDACMANPGPLLERTAATVARDLVAATSSRGGRIMHEAANGGATMQPSRDRGTKRDDGR